MLHIYNISHLRVKEVGKVRSECEGNEGTDCEDGDSDTGWYRQVQSDTLCVLGV